MNASQVIARVLATTALAFAGTAVLADDVTVAPEQAISSTTTRAEVRAEVLQAREAGALAAAGEQGVKPAVATRSAVSRDEVRADARKGSSRTLSGLYLPA